jgi:hypothetical protein
MKSLTLDELRELAPAYVMGTLSGDDLAFFNASLTDPAIAAALAPEIAAHRAATEFLATERAVTPPPSLRLRLGERIAAERAAALRSAETQELPVASIVPETARATTGDATPMPGSTSSPTPARATRFTPRVAAPPVRRTSTAGWVTSGVFGLALAASLFFAVTLRSRVQTLEDELHMQEALVKKSGERLAYRDSTVHALTLAENDLLLVRLASTSAKPTSMQVFWNRKTGEAVVHASGFSQVAANRTYCLWIIRNGKPEAVKLFNPDPDGHRLMNAVALPTDLAGVTAMAVTEEPAEGSPQPTMQPFLVGAVVAPK